MRVLLIDDEPRDLGELVLRKLRKTIPEVNVRQVPTCEEGLTALGMGEFDIVLLDQKLLDIRGTECLRKIRGVTQCIPVVMFTGYATDELMEECMREGADDFVPKNLIDILLPHAVWSATRRRAAKKRIEQEVRQKKKQIDAIGKKLGDDR